LAVEAVIGEPVSDREFPDNRENTGNFCGFSRGDGARLCFLHHKTDGYGEIPYASGQGIF
jgi:hypothetical protein